MSDVIQKALKRLTETTAFGEAIIHQTPATTTRVIYDGQCWSTTNEQAAIKQAEMSISLPELNFEKYQLFAEAYLDDQQAPGLFAECWQGSAAQRHCSEEMHMYLEMMIEEDRQINVQPQAKQKEQSAA